MQHIKCAICGTEFEAPDKRYRLYCSRKCAKKAQKIREKSFHIKQKEEKQLRKPPDIDKAIRAADKNNISYGKYMMQLYMQSCRTIRGD